MAAALQYASRDRVCSFVTRPQSSEQEIGCVQVEKPARDADVRRSLRGGHNGNRRHHAESGLHGVIAVEADGQIELMFGFSLRNQDDVQHPAAMTLMKR